MRKTDARGEDGFDPGRAVERVTFNDKWLTTGGSTGTLFRDLGQRIRDIRQGPDGLLSVLTDESMAQCCGSTASHRTGRRGLSLPNRRMTVIGVAADTDAMYVGQRASGVAYLPLDQQYEPRLLLAARMKADPEAFVGPLRAAIAGVDPDLALAQIGTGLALAGPNTTFARIVRTSASLLGLMALVLALAGLYGVLSQVVAGRAREIGVRLALGAGTSAIRRMVIAQGLSPVVIGLVAGLGFGLIARAGMQPLFSRLLPVTDVTLIIFLPALFLGAGLVACYLPARRASRVDPNVALRNL